MIDLLLIIATLIYTVVGACFFIVFEPNIRKRWKVAVFSLICGPAGFLVFLVTSIYKSIMFVLRFIWDKFNMDRKCDKILYWIFW